MLVFISLKECVCQLIDFHKPEKENMIWLKQIMQKSTHNSCYHHLNELSTTMTSCIKSSESIEGFK